MKMMEFLLSEDGWTHIDSAKETKRCRKATQRQLSIYIANGPKGAEQEEVVGWAKEVSDRKVVAKSLTVDVVG